MTFQASPLPCSDEVLDCRWLAPGISMSRFKPYVCDSFLLSDGHSHVTVKAEVTRLDAEGITFKLPESGYEKSCRTVERHACEGIDARLIQAGLSFEGRLADFNALSFRVELEAPPTGSLRWINSTAPITALFSRGEELLYSGECLISRMDRGLAKREIVLAPDFNNIRRYKPREHRSQRHVLSPDAGGAFPAPLHRQAGLPACQEYLGGGTLRRGVLRALHPAPGHGHRRALHRDSQPLRPQMPGAGPLSKRLPRREGREHGPLRHRPPRHGRQGSGNLSSFLHQSVDDRLRVGGSVDLEELWRFFFETGFIYPSKYLSIEAHKEEFRRTYEKLYLDSPSIARHFLIQDKGQIFGHMSMIRFYSNAWIIQHHAATRDGHAQAGVAVFDQTGRYCKDFHLHPSTHMDYIMCYYRRENRFPLASLRQHRAARRGSTGMLAGQLRLLRPPQRPRGHECALPALPGARGGLPRAVASV